MLRPVIPEATIQFLHSRLQTLTSNVKLLVKLKNRICRVSRPNTEQHPAAISKPEKKRQCLPSYLTKFTHQNALPPFQNAKERLFEFGKHIRNWLFL